MMGVRADIVRIGRIGALSAALALVFAGTGGAAAQESGAPAGPRITVLRVHGNHTTPDADVLALAGVSPGDAFTPALAEAVERRLEASGRFRSVEVRQRFASLSDAQQVMLVIVVEERAGIRIDVPSPGPLGRLAASTMWLPVVRREDGYGFTYGARLSFVDLLGRRTRVSVPLTWGGERRAAAEVERTFGRGPFSRVHGSVGVWRREHPADDVPERRVEATARAERAVAPWLRVGGSVRRSHVWFAGPVETASAAGVDIALDTSRNPAFPRDAVQAHVAWERLWFERAPDTSRRTIDLRGYVGLPGSAVLAVRGQQTQAGGPLPRYAQALLGGTSSLRGFRLGYRAGDRLAAASAELRVPLSSPLRMSRAGVTLFSETGAAYGAGTPLSRARFDVGVGGGVFAQWPFGTVRLDVARGLGSGTRVHVSLGLAM